MIKVENINVFNFSGALRGLRNPLNSWHLSDSDFGIANLDWGLEDSNFDTVFEKYLSTFNIQDDDTIEKVERWLCDNGLSEYLGYNQYSEHSGEYAFIGPKDLDLMERMTLAGTDESKFLRQIFISMDITAPLSFWKEADTYKVGTVANSCSTMHTLDKKPITKDMFSFDTPDDWPNEYWNDEWPSDLDTSISNEIIETLEWLRQRYKETKNKVYWRYLIDLLPDGFMQKRTLTLNYQVARAMYFARRNHKKTEWRDFCKILSKLPYASNTITLEKRTLIKGENNDN